MNLDAAEDNLGFGAETKTSNNRPMKIPKKHSEIGDIATASSGAMSREQGPVSPMHIDVQVRLLGRMEPTVEPLKVCLDDDSSIEDGDEDMFDDDAFYFDDEDFEALLSHESMKRTRLSTAPASASLANCQRSLQPPLHHSASMFNDLGIGGVTVSSSSTALSSTGKFGRGGSPHG